MKVDFLSSFPSSPSSSSSPSNFERTCPTHQRDHSSLTIRFSCSQSIGFSAYSTRLLSLPSLSLELQSWPICWIEDQLLYQRLILLLLFLNSSIFWAPRLLSLGWDDSSTSSLSRLWTLLSIAMLGIMANSGEINLIGKRSVAWNNNQLVSKRSQILLRRKKVRRLTLNDILSSPFLYLSASSQLKSTRSFSFSHCSLGQDVIVITGGGNGIGKCLVEHLSQVHHAKIAVLDFGPPLYRPAPKGAPSILYVKTDVSSVEAVKEAGKQVRAQLGEPSFLVNCAGIASGNPILDVSIEGAKRVWQINTLSYFITCQEFLPNMIKRNHGWVSFGEVSIRLRVEVYVWLFLPSSPTVILSM